MSFAERRKHVQKMRDYIVDHAEELAGIVSRENGKLRLDALTTEVAKMVSGCSGSYAASQGLPVMPRFVLSPWASAQVAPPLTLT